jgi:uncharacterized protein
MGKGGFDGCSDPAVHPQGGDRHGQDGQKTGWNSRDPHRVSLPYTEDSR